jgi:hypothetical protein
LFETWHQADYEYQKYANIDSSKILEENLILSNDHGEVIFKVAEEKEQQNYGGFISLDLKNKMMNLWCHNFEEFMSSKDSPY